MAYATRQDMVNSFGEYEVRTLTDRDDTGEIDDAVLAAGLEDASAEIDTFLGGRYGLPLQIVPRFLASKCCDICRYHLTGAGTTCTEEIQKRYDLALKFLKLIATGQITLGADATGVTVEPRNVVKSNRGTKIFSNRDRGGY
ncbi:hypothetical protein PAN31117_05399 [Pandoraea anapnoica]|uniref:Mu-like prophage protein gp36 n=1 Tax=Pandoraea anapnoica TaxID=2508301 RepID=A0A5E5AUW5_9BURK|nr:phage protein Gp36 family protein [Pandoraea anapnoica]VVE76455.1 hypothetical protein PAN31117_05399 [Pandoraea anapnoica]